MRYANMPEFYLINFVGMSAFCVASFACKLFISFKISSLLTHQKLKCVPELQLFFMAIMLG